MKESGAVVPAALLAALLVAGCRQPDGAIPVPTGEQPNKIEDIARDLQNLAGGDAGARRELLEDLDNLDEHPRPEPPLRDLADVLAAALAGLELDEARARRLADQLFVAATARALSPRQIDQLASDVRGAMLAAGADDRAAERVSVAVRALSEARTENRRRWFHVF